MDGSDLHLGHHVATEYFTVPNNFLGNSLSPWNSMEFPGEHSNYFFVNKSMEFYGVPWNSMEFHGILVELGTCLSTFHPWNSTYSLGTPRNSLEFFKLPSNSIDFCSIFGDIFFHNTNSSTCKNILILIHSFILILILILILPTIILMLFTCFFGPF